MQINGYYENTSSINSAYSQPTLQESERVESRQPEARSESSESSSDTSKGRFVDTYA